MKLDILAIGAHPDDVELSCGGTLIKSIRAGKKVGILDLTKGELGTRGSASIRANEAAAAQHVLGVSIRENLGIEDGWFQNNKDTQMKLIQKIRLYQPSIILANAIDDRHPDHPRAAALVKDAVFLAGLQKIITKERGVVQDIHRTKYLFHYIQYRHIKPDFVVDVTPYYEDKMKAVQCYKTQFYNPDEESNTLISSKKFLDFLDGRSREMGGSIQVEHGEGFLSDVPLQLDLNTFL
ncbi:bacillithiol biosynthesis deacetylase BshB1 [Bacteroidia bacterium]|nr:bacillithiol biosynthesis deacetylase BshB1 [Bacteroidia bacterium]